MKFNKVSKKFSLFFKTLKTYLKFVKNNFKNSLQFSIFVLFLIKLFNKL